MKLLQMLELNLKFPSCFVLVDILYNICICSSINSDWLSIDRNLETEKPYSDFHNDQTSIKCNKVCVYPGLPIIFY